METVRIYRLKDLDRRTRARLKDAQREAARVWMYCLGRHQTARNERTRWPDRDDLQRETKGGQFALHSQSIQMVCQQFLANVQTSKQLRQMNPQHRYPYHSKRYMTVQWPAQAVSRQGKRLILPMGRGRKSFSFHLPNLPEQVGAVSLVWRGGYELHLVVPAAPQAASALAVQAAVDLGEIHQAAVTTRCTGARTWQERAPGARPAAQRDTAGGGLLPCPGRADALCGRPARGAQGKQGAPSQPAHGPVGIRQR
jgi:putative transposase